MIIVGLGNPGREYEKTRHNAGYMALDFFARKHRFPAFGLQKKHNALISEKDGVTLVKPQTFMNNSGKAVKNLARLSYPQLNSVKFVEFVVIHDDIDIPLGTVKVSQGRGSAGHKGVESIITKLGTKNFTRIRIGIQPAQGKPDNTEEFVLQKFSKEENQLLQQAFEQTSQILDEINKKG